MRRLLCQAKVFCLGSCLAVILFLQREVEGFISPFTISGTLAHRTKYIHEYYLKYYLQSTSKDEDWREFRAKLVGATTFDSGTLIEKGSIVLSQVEDSLGCHDLNQPYMHKAVILILEHVEGDFTKGILLNRPTDLVLTDDDIIYVDDEGNPMDQRSLQQQQRSAASDSEQSTTTTNIWPIYFGGDLAGLFDEQQQPMIACLYRPSSSPSSSIDDSNYDDGVAVLSDIYVTSHANACTLIADGKARPTDFLIFYGFCGWEAGQLLREIKRGSWTMVTTNADTIWNELQRQPLNHRAAGIEMWESFSNRIDKDATKGRGSFSDLMLKAWSSEMLCLGRENDDDLSYDDKDLQRVLDMAAQGLQNDDNDHRGVVVDAGILVRASASPPSLYLLKEQYLHKSIVLLLHDSDEASVGLVLNLPSTESFLLKTPGGRQATFPIRYGGASGTSGQHPLLWLHCSRSLRKLGIGSSVNRDLRTPIWMCTVDQVAEAIDLDLALPREFLVIQGFSVWEKEQQGAAGGMNGQINAGYFEMVSSRSAPVVENIWALLQSQEGLTEDTLDCNLQNALDAWRIAGLDPKAPRPLDDDNDDDHVVFDSHVRLSDLADDALRAWIRIFLLGDAEYAPS